MPSDTRLRLRCRRSPASTLLPVSAVPTPFFRAARRDGTWMRDDKCAISSPTLLGGGGIRDVADLEPSRFQAGAGRGPVLGSEIDVAVSRPLREGAGSRRYCSGSSPWRRAEATRVRRLLNLRHHRGSLAAAAAAAAAAPDVLSVPASQRLCSRASSESLPCSSRLRRHSTARSHALPQRRRPWPGRASRRTRGAVVATPRIPSRRTRSDLLRAPRRVRAAIHHREEERASRRQK